MKIQLSHFDDFIDLRIYFARNDTNYKGTSWRADSLERKANYFISGTIKPSLHIWLPTLTLENLEQQIADKIERARNKTIPILVNPSTKAPFKIRWDK